MISNQTKAILIRYKFFVALVFGFATLIVAELTQGYYDPIYTESLFWSSYRIIGFSILGCVITVLMVIYDEDGDDE